MLHKIRGFHIGAMFLLVLLLASFLLPLVSSEPAINLFQYNTDERHLEMPPYSPSFDHWLGTDRNGKDLLYALIEGSKYTIIFAFIITFARILISLLFGLFLKRIFMNSWFNGLMQGFQYIPQSLFSLLVLSPLLIYELRAESHYTYSETLIIQLIVLIGAGIFPLTKIITDTSETLSHTEYVICSKHMGASAFQITIRHILPHLVPRLFVLSGRQFTTVLTLMLHLSLYHVFIGGVKITSGQEHDQFSSYTTPSNEWTGLISMNHRELMLEPFVVLVPVLAYALLILFVNSMAKNLEKNSAKRTLPQ
ncbi:ABC transporter permease subunit [Bacillus sp. NEB1478]|uniref:ABC transporter permease n=1 Tax=Bacillus sp. NEB1478 TaxID=3073816 RepID=UPI0028733349|nr:ABC transporter permease subunit [Bacillus sp. NEB1478]WNB91587.1 ABC transporter permease subunit [Bacillus sp. NEB1478]